MSCLWSIWWISNSTWCKKLWTARALWMESLFWWHLGLMVEGCQSECSVSVRTHLLTQNDIEHEINPWWFALSSPPTWYCSILPKGFDLVDFGNFVWKWLLYMILMELNGCFAFCFCMFSSVTLRGALNFQDVLEIFRFNLKALTCIVSQS